MATDTCSIHCVHLDKVARVKQALAKHDPYQTVKLFKALSDETRMKIVYALAIEEELCVCDVAAIINGSNAAASHHLRLLRNLGIATSRKEGKLVYYSLIDERVKLLVMDVFPMESGVEQVGSSYGK